MPSLAIYPFFPILNMNNRFTVQKPVRLLSGRIFNPAKEVSAALIRVKDPYLSFTALLEEFHKKG